MSREKGVASFSASFESQSSMPIDARMIAGTKADLILDATWTANDGNKYAYIGMIVSVHSDSTPANNGVYRLKALPYTTAANWEQLGTGGGGASAWTPAPLAGDANKVLTATGADTATWQTPSGGSTQTIMSSSEGEALTVGNPVCIVSGVMYKLDATLDSRTDFCGFYSTTNTAVCSGVATPVGGGSYIVGQLVYGSVTTPGSTTQTAPSAATQWIIPLGVAISTTQVAINPSLSADSIYIDAPVPYQIITASGEGESLTAGNAVYISKGNANGDTGRTAGYMYKLDPTNSNRMDFCGFYSTTNVAICGGTIAPTGGGSYTLGQPVYGSVSTLGSTTQTAPSATTQWIIPLGIASSATEIIINPSLSADAIYIDGPNSSSFAITNNTSSPTNVTGMGFDNATTRGGQFIVSIYINATTSLYETIVINAIQRTSDWLISQNAVGDTSGIVFNITSAGQIQYTCSNYSGFISGTIKWARITDTTGLGNGGESRILNMSHTSGTSIAIGTGPYNLYQKIYTNLSTPTTLSATTPFGSSTPADGTRITIIGNSDTNTITLVQSDTALGAILAGTWVGGLYDSLELVYDLTLNRFIEVNRSNK